MIICDIDNTLLRNGTQPIKRTIDYINAQKTRVVIVTGRTRNQRTETVAALNAAGVKYNSLLMNPYTTAESNKWKSECADKLSNATLAIDDNEGARSAYRKAGIKAVHPNSLPDAEKMWQI